MVSRFVILLLLPLFVVQAYGQETTFQATVNKSTVALNENFSVTFKINSSGNRFTPPNLSEDFIVLQGPMSNSQMYYSNGRVTSSVSYQYTLRARSIGEFIIEPASIQVDGEKISSNPVKITVTKAQKPKQDQGNQQKANGNRQRNNSNQASNNKLFVSGYPSKREVYLGEQVLISYDLYSQLDIATFEYDKVPDYQGFYTTELEVKPSSGRSQKEYKGRIYTVFPLKKTIVFPQIANSGEIEPMELSFIVNVREDQPVNTWFGPRYRYREEQRKVVTNAIKLKVKPLPYNSPKDFTGSVGKFSLKGGFDKYEAAINQAITLKFTLTGTGNIKVADVELPKWPSDFELYDPEIKTNTSLANNVMSGSKTWEILMIPRTAGTFEIPPISFTYFNPKSKKYETTATEKFTINVNGDGFAPSNGGTNVASTVQKDIEKIGSDIRYIRTENIELEKNTTNWLNSPFFWFFLILPFIGLSIVVAFLKYKAQQDKDVVGMKQKRAYKTALKQLTEAEKFLQENNQKDFFDKVYKTVYGYLANKMNISVGELNKNNISEKLKTSGVSENDAKAVVELLQQCEMANYAPIGISAQEILNNAKNVIDNTETALK